MNAAGLPWWVDILGWSLVHLLWQGALVGVAFAALRALVPKGQSGLRYAIGLGALGVLAIAPVATFFHLAASAQVVVAGPAFGAPDIPVALAATRIDDLAGGGAALLPWLVAAWLCGVVVMAARAFGQWHGLERIATRLAWREADIDVMLARVAERFGGLARASVLVSRHIDTPTLIGWVRPVILLPAAVALGFPRHQVELILAHELGHLRRYDHLVNLGQAVVETLLFYHPVVHWISREVRHEREVCCDQLVLRLTRGEPREYARTLAALEDLRQLPPQLAVAASGGFLLDRVRRIVAPVPARDGRGRARWLVALGVAGMVATVAAIVRRDTDVSFARMDPLPVAASTAPLVAGSLDIVLPAGSVDPVPLALLPRMDAPPSITAGPQVSVGMPVASGPAEVMNAVGAIPATHRSIEPPALDVADVEIDAAAPVALAVAPASAPRRAAPKLVRRVDPVYPDVNIVDSRGHVEFEFAIDDDGNVRDISIVSGDSRGAFAVAARRALRQWRFAANDLAARSGERFRQDFAFVGISQKAVASDDPICARDTGSHLCRPGRSLGMTTEVEVSAPAEAPRPVARVDTPVATTLVPAAQRGGAP